MKRASILVVLAALATGPSFAGGYTHLTCPAFVAMDSAQQVLFTKGFLSGLGTVLGVLNSSVHAVEKTNPDMAKGAEMAEAGVQRALSGDAAASDVEFAKLIAARCAQPEYAERPAAAAAVDLLMKAKP